MGSNTVSLNASHPTIANAKLSDCSRQILTSSDRRWYSKMRHPSERKSERAKGKREQTAANSVRNGRLGPIVCTGSGDGPATRQQQLDHMALGCRRCGPLDCFPGFTLSPSNAGTRCNFAGERRLRPEGPQAVGGRASGWNGFCREYCALGTGSSHGPWRRVLAGIALLFRKLDSAAVLDTPASNYHRVKLKTVESPQYFQVTL